MKLFLAGDPSLFMAGRVIYGGKTKDSFDSFKPKESHSFWGVHCRGMDKDAMGIVVWGVLDNALSSRGVFGWEAAIHQRTHSRNFWSLEDDSMLLQGGWKAAV